MVPIHDKACPECIGTELLPDVVRMPLDQRVCTVAKVCGKFRTSINCGLDILRRSIRVS